MILRNIRLGKTGNKSEKGINFNQSERRGGLENGKSQSESRISKIKNRPIRKENYFSANQRALFFELMKLNLEIYENFIVYFQVRISDTSKYSTNYKREKGESQSESRI